MSDRTIRETVGEGRFLAGARTAEHGVFYGREVSTLDREELLYLIYSLSEEKKFAREAIEAISKNQRTPWVEFGRRS